jgi:hypothetical protein
MFGLPLSENVVPEGLARNNPIRLGGIEKSDFKQLIRFMNIRLVVVLE